MVIAHQWSNYLRNVRLFLLKLFADRCDSGCIFDLFVEDGKQIFLLENERIRILRGILSKLVLLTGNNNNN